MQPRALAVLFTLVAASAATSQFPNQIVWNNSGGGSWGTTGNWTNPFGFNYFHTGVTPTFNGSFPGPNGGIPINIFYDPGIIPYSGLVFNTPNPINIVQSSSSPLTIGFSAESGRIDVLIGSSSSQPHAINHFLRDGSSTGAGIVVTTHGDLRINFNVSNNSGLTGTLHKFGGGTLFLGAAQANVRHLEGTLFLTGDAPGTITVLNGAAIRGLTNSSFSTARNLSSTTAPSTASPCPSRRQT